MNKHNLIDPVFKDFNPEDYHFFGLWRQNLFSAGFWVGCFDKEVADKLGIETEESGAMVLTEGNFCLKNSEIANIKKQIWEHIDSRDESYFKNMVKVSDQYFQEAVDFGKTIVNREFASKDLLEYLKIGRKVTFLWMLGAEQFSEAAQEKLAAVAVEELYPAEAITDLIPKFETPLNQQHREVVELKKEIGQRTLDNIQKNDPKLYERLKNHAKRFAWIELANLIGEPLTIERLYEQIVHSKDDPIQTVKSNIVPSERLAFHALCLSYCGYIRQAGAEYFFMLTEKAQPYLKSIAQKFGLTYDEFLLQTNEEIMDALDGKISPETLKQNALRRRPMDLVLFAGKGDQINFSENPHDIVILKKMILPQIDKNQNELKGQVGNKGKYTGKVKIIMDVRDFAKMETGDVLVSTMTTPDFVVLMHKAGAIITDIGGMLCHAAIVSREINKPCVIGTKFATKTLKDGDMVEVDAEKGIVKILK